MIISVVFLVPVSFIYTRASFAVLILVPQRVRDVCVSLAADSGSLSSEPWWWAPQDATVAVDGVWVMVWRRGDGRVFVTCIPELRASRALPSESRCVLCDCSHAQHAAQTGPCYTGKLGNSHNGRAPFFLYASFQFCVPSFKNSDLESVQYMLEKTVNKVSIVFLFVRFIF